MKETYQHYSDVLGKVATYVLKTRFNKGVLFKKIFKIFLNLFLERGEGREKERQRNTNVWLPLTSLWGTWPATLACVLTRNRTSNPLVHRLALNPVTHTSQGKEVVLNRNIWATPDRLMKMKILLFHLVTLVTLRREFWWSGSNESITSEHEKQNWG